MIIINVTFLPDNCFNIRVSRPVDQSCCKVVLLQTAEHRKKVREEKNQTNNDLSQPYSPIFSTILWLPQVKYNSSTEAWWAAEMLHFRSGSGSWRLRAFPMLLLSEQSRKHNGGLAYTCRYTVDAYRVCMCMWVTRNRNSWEFTNPDSTKYQYHLSIWFPVDSHIHCNGVGKK